MHDNAAIKDVIKQSTIAALCMKIRSEQEKEAWNALLKRAIGVDA